MRVSKKESKKPGIIRPFGNVECYEFHMLQLRFLGSTVVNSRYTIPTSLAAAELHDRVVARVEDALARVVLEHPALRLDVVGADTKRPAWVAVDEIDFGHHVSWEDVGGDDGAGVEYDEILRDRIERLLDEPYTRLAGRPHWRVLVLFSGRAASFLDIVFDYSHAFSDGTSGKIFHETLLRQLDASPTTETETETKQDAVLANRVLRIPPTARSLPRPIEDIAEFRVSARFALATAWKELLPARLASASAAHANWAPIRAAPYKTRLRTFDVEGAALRRILAACRARGTTLTGLLHALVLVAVAAHVDADDAVAFMGDTALDLRRHVEHVDLDPQRTMANYVSLMAHRFGPDLVHSIREELRRRDESGGDDAALTPALVGIVWPCAVRVRREIQERLDCGLKNDLVGLMKLVPDWRAQLRTEASKARPYSFVVTNLGVLDGARTPSDPVDDAEDRGWGIEHSVFAISAEVCGAAFQVSAISARDGALCVGCSWQDCVVDLKMAEAIVADLARWLRFLGES